MKKSDKALVVSSVLLALMGATVYYYWDKVDENTDGGNNVPQVAVVNNFDECLSAGYATEESYPRQCRTPDGRTFVEDIGNELEKTDLVRIATPRPNDTIQSPVKITGEARGFWFNEASFPIRVYDAAGKELGTAIAEAKSDWMTEEFVPFEATLNFEAPTTAKGTLVLQKDNPSGLPENDDELIVPVAFGEAKQTQQVSLYYYSESKDKDATGNIKCSEDGLTEVKRNIAKSDFVIEDTIKLLIGGKLTAEEKNAGISTEYPLEGFELEKSALDANGVLTLTFKDPQNKTSGGSCRVGIMRSQIEATAKQFAEVKSVKILPEEILQP